MRKLIAAIIMAVTLSLLAGSATAHAATTAETKAHQVAAKQLGKPYSYGAAGPKSFDCSGLVVYAYKTTKKNPPRTAQGQFNASILIKKADARKGDLVFFTKKGASKPMHVGIVSQRGGERMIHANAASFLGYRVINEHIRPGDYWPKNYKVQYGRLK